LSWHVFVTQFERRFYPATFLEEMKIDLHNYKQEKMSVIEYEVGFNKIVRFVPHVAYDEIEKAGRFRQGLKPLRSGTHWELFHWLTFTLLWSKLWVWRCSSSTLMRCRNLQALTTLAVRMIRRDIRVVLFIRRISPIAISHIAVNLHSLVLQELLHSTVLFLSPAWDWCAFVVVMNIDVLSVSGLGGVLYVARTTRMWCARRIQI
jgi:hypothetical protein